MPRDEQGHSVRRRNISFLRRKIDRLAEQQHQCRHSRERTDKRTNDTFGKHDTHICAYFQTHETEHQQTYYRRQSRRKDRRSCTLDSIIRGYTCRFFISMLVLLLTVTVQQHDTVIERKHRLQDRADEVRGDGYRRQQGVRTHIQHDSEQGGDQDHHGLKPTLCHHKQHYHDQHGSEDHDRHRRCGAVLTRLHYAVSTKTVTDLLA